MGDLLKVLLVAILICVIADALVSVAALDAAGAQAAGGPDTRPRYYKSPGVSLWPFEMTNIVRHANGRVWIDINPNGSGMRTGDGKPEIRETIDIILWSQVPIASIRIYDVTTDQLLLAEDGDGILTCHREQRVRVFPKRYVICGIDMPPMDTVLHIEVTDDNVNEFVYKRSLSSMAAEIRKSHDWLVSPKE